MSVIEAVFPNVQTTAGYLGPSQSDVSTNGFVATNTSGGAKTVPLRTVSAGKKFMITDIYIATDAASSTSLHIQITKNGVAVFDGLIHNLTPITETLETQIAGVAADVFALVIPQTTGAQNVAYRIGQIEF